MAGGTPDINLDPGDESGVVIKGVELRSTASGDVSQFQAIFRAAVKSYQKQTKSDLIAQPIFSQLQSCDSTSAIVTILQNQVREFEKSRSADERLTKWLSPTVNVLSAFSAAVSGGVDLVSLDRRASKRFLKNFL